MPTVYKYCRPERIDIFETGMLMLSRPSIFNDPFELKPHYQTLEQFLLPIPENASEQALAQIAEMQKRLDEKVLPPSAIDSVLENSTSTIVLLSLSEVRDSLLMWAHYAAAHTGFVIGFESPEKILAVESPHRHIAKVTYAAERPSKITFEEITNDELLLTKSKEWEYEQEWRILDSLFSANGEASREVPNCWPFRFLPESVKEVIVGCRADPAFVEKLEAVLDGDDKYEHVDQLRAFRHRKDYKLRISCIWDKEW